MNADRSRPGIERVRKVYLDYHASTPCDPRVVEAMLPFLVEHYANPASAVHEHGKRASDAVARGREQVGSAIGAAPAEIVFTSGATESNNLAILGVARACRRSRHKVIVSAIEHKCVLNAAKQLAREGFNVRTIPVDSEGLIDLGSLVSEADENTCLVSIQIANNEIGTIQSVEEIAQVVHRVGAVFHTDAAQALGRIEIDVKTLDVDLLSLSAHKCYGPKGIGALYVRGGARGTPIEPLMYGGGQEYDLRPGTLNVPGIVGFGVAASLASKALDSDTDSLRQMRDRLEALIFQGLDGVCRNGCVRRRLAGNSSLTFDAADAEAIIANLPGIAVSTGSACSAGAIDPSHVLIAIGLSRKQAHQTIRFGLGRYTMPGEMDYVVARLIEAVTRVRGVEAVGRLVPQSL